MEISVDSVVSATMAMKNQNLQLAYQMGLLRASFNQETQSMRKLLEALPQPVEQVNLPHLGRSVDIRA
jgi:hypothetical protein